MAKRVKNFKKVPKDFSVSTQEDQRSILKQKINLKRFEICPKISNMGKKCKMNYLKTPFKKAISESTEKGGNVFQNGQSI